MINFEPLPDILQQAQMPIKLPIYSFRSILGGFHTLQNEQLQKKTVNCEPLGLCASHGYAAARRPAQKTNQEILLPQWQISH